MASSSSRSARRLTGWLGAAALAVGGILTPAAAIAAEPASGSASESAAISAGDTVHIGPKQGYGGTGIFPIWYGSAAVGDPDGWAYCVEHNIGARADVDGRVDSLDDYLGTNAFLDKEVKDRVLWVLSHSYPTIDLDQLAAAAGITGLAVNDAIEATQYAIWRYTDLGFDAAWNWETPNSEAVYWYLVHGANAAPSPVPFPTVATATITAPSARQTAGSLVGPFTVTTNQASVGIDAQGVPVTDAQGTPINPSAVTNGQAVYLDLRTQKVAGTATITVTAAAAGPTGNIISVATPENTEPSADAHAQSIVLVQARTATTRAQVAASWFAAQATEPTAGGSTPTSGPGTTAGPNATAAPGASSAPAGALSTSDASRAGAQNARLASTGESFPALALGIAVVLLALGLTARRIRGSRRDA